MGLFGDTISSVKSINIRQNLIPLVTFVVVCVLSALTTWTVLTLIIGTESTVTVVFSGSMEPGFTRGDVLFLHMNNDSIRAGEIIVFNVNEKDIPICHRVIKVHERRDSREILVLTKGDNNDEDDWLGMLYAPGQKWLERHHIMGRAFGILPYVGFLNIVLTETPITKLLQYIVIVAVGLFIFQRIRSIYFKDKRND